ncbi:hypothetical protein VNO80_30118 [Phaseolus coccineus]|uniref:Transcription factor CBF/NF-Y/archaeal histone domain-containing protein n=1 Tax=Phaseolus coccineus TaxID=3886 RepID=A0AAN9QD52_PHACN
MEHGGSFFHIDQHVKSSSVPLQQENNYTNMEIAAPINSDECQNPNLIGRDKSKMPITNVTKIMRKFLPNNAKVSDGAKEMIQLSATYYITFVTKKAKEKCLSEYRKIMNADDLLWAIENVGFDDYIGPLGTFLQRCRNLEGGIHGPTFGPGLNHVEMPHPPLPPPPPPPPPPPAAVYSSGLDFSMHQNTNPDMFDTNGVGGFLDGVGCSTNAFINFDPFSLFQQDQL